MYRIKSGNKYSSESQSFEGHHYDSKAEAGYAADLSLRKKAGDIQDWRPHVTLDLLVNGQRVGTYQIDFIVTHNDGHLEFVEVKGMVLPLWRQKWAIFEATYKDRWPDADLTVVKVGQQRQRWNKRDVDRARRRVFGAKA